MFVSDGAMVRAQQPSLEQRHDLMNVWHELRRGCGLALEKRDPMLVAVTAQGDVSQPAVRVDKTARFDDVLRKSHQACRRRIWNPSQANLAETASFDLHRNCNQGFGFRLTSAPVRALTPVF